MPAVPEPDASLLEERDRLVAAIADRDAEIAALEAELAELRSLDDDA